MKKPILALTLLLCLSLTGCSNLLDRSYQVSSPHVDRPTTAEDSSALRVENYRDLVSAVLYLVSQGEEDGEIRLYDYPGDVESALSAACLEVATLDPLGAYCVDYIRHECTRVVSYDQATISIHYRRTPEQVQSMVNVTGTRAIRTELQSALGQFEEEVVLRVAYFAEDAQSIADLVRQAYYDNPASALGMPRMEINLYPESGLERVVEVLLTYPGETDELLKKKEALTERAGELAAPHRTLSGRTAALQLLRTLREEAAYDPEGADTPYAALLEGGANDRGLSLAYLLLCQEKGLSGQLVEGTVASPDGGEDRARCWNMIAISGGRLYLDPSLEEPALYTARELFDLGYRWEGAPAEETGVQDQESQTTE